MSNRLHIATRKGLFTLDRKRSGWAISNASFLGDNCTIVMHDPRNGASAKGKSRRKSGEATLYVAIDHGHFGVKMHRSRDGGDTWQEIAAPKYPPKPDDYQPRMTPAEGKPYDWALKLVWALSHGGTDEPGVIWAGTLPGGLFKSNDHGESWELNRPLWDDPRREEWFGGGAEQPGIHSICVNPRDCRHIIVGVSCGGTWVTHDGGESWNLRAKGMRAE